MIKLRSQDQIRNSFLVSLDLESCLSEAQEIVFLVSESKQPKDGEEWKQRRLSDFVFIKKSNGLRVSPSLILAGPFLTHTKSNGFRVKKLDAAWANPIDKSPY